MAETPNGQESQLIKRVFSTSRVGDVVKPLGTTLEETYGVIHRVASLTDSAANLILSENQSQISLRKTNDDYTTVYTFDQDGLLLSIRRDRKGDIFPSVERKITYEDDSGGQKKIAKVEDYIDTETGQVLAIRSEEGKGIEMYPDLPGYNDIMHVFSEPDALQTHDVRATLMRLQQSAEAMALLKIEQNESTLTVQFPQIIYDRDTYEPGSQNLVMRTVVLQEVNGRLVPRSSAYSPDFAFDTIGIRFYPEVYTFQYNTAGQVIGIDHEAVFPTEQGRLTLVPYEQRRFQPVSLQTTSGEMVNVYNVHERLLDPSNLQQPPHEENLSFVDWVIFGDTTAGKRAVFSVRITDEVEGSHGLEPYKVERTNKDAPFEFNINPVILERDPNDRFLYRTITLLPSDTLKEKGAVIRVKLRLTEVQEGVLAIDRNQDLSIELVSAEQ